MKLKNIVVAAVIALSTQTVKAESVSLFAKESLVGLSVANGMIYKSSMLASSPLMVAGVSLITELVKAEECKFAEVVGTVGGAVTGAIAGATAALAAVGGFGTVCSGAILAFPVT